MSGLDTTGDNSYRKIRSGFTGARARTDFTPQVYEPIDLKSAIRALISDDNISEDYLKEARKAIEEASEGKIKAFLLKGEL